jgi:membrane peptidoglycan carboxypeptidase
VGGLYELDRYDLAARTTIDSAGQREATALLRSLAERDFVHSSGLDAERLLGQQDPARVRYGFLLYERAREGNVVRIQVDNLDRPFDLNLGARLELGSTAKLRTLVTYLEIVAGLHAELADTSAESSSARTAGDPITRWVRATMDERPDASVSDLLALAMKRRYSASPGETFFTGGGVHNFANFDRTHDREAPTVTEGFRHSINLVFVRLMRDIVQYHEHRLPWFVDGLYNDPANPARRAILQRFADREGRTAIERAFRRHHRLSADSSLARLAGGRATPQRYARVLRAVASAITADSLRAAVRSRFPDVALTDAELRAIERAVPANLNLADRAFVTGTEPLELWVVSTLRAKPAVTLPELQEQGARARQDAHAWLFRHTQAVRRAQDRSIRIMLERDAFERIHAAWRNVGYPYEDIVPSLGTSIGSAGDRPGALAELVGILIAEGVRRAPVQVMELEFAKGTPFEVLLRRDTIPGERVMAPEVATTALSALRDVVANGTATTIRDALPGPGLVIGGKTGTGDNVVRTFGAGGRVVSTRTVSRTATFVFAIGDRFYGVATAYVDGPAADQYAFTSGLPVRVVRLLLPRLPFLTDSVPYARDSTSASER